MKCPECGKPAEVLETRRSKKHGGMRRRYECFNGHRFTTMETVVQLKKEKQDEQKQVA